MIIKIALCVLCICGIAAIALIVDRYFRSLHQKKETPQTQKPATPVTVSISVYLSSAMDTTTDDADSDEWKYCANPDCGSRFVVVPSDAKRCAECGHSLQDYCPDDEEPLPTDFNERIFKRVHDLVDERIAAYQRLKFQRWCYENGKLTEFPDEQHNDGEQVL
jgi:hypothetical protein